MGGFTRELQEAPSFRAVQLGRVAGVSGGPGACQPKWESGFYLLGSEAELEVADGQAGAQ